VYFQGWSIRPRLWVTMWNLLGKDLYNWKGAQEIALAGDSTSKKCS
jgi:hypothetical protein